MPSLLLHSIIVIIYLFVASPLRAAEDSILPVYLPAILYVLHAQADTPVDPGDPDTPVDPGDPGTPVDPEEYPLHRDITVTVFWVGEQPSADNGYISNTQSAWDIRWVDHYGGVDDPDSRQGYRPASFVPLENPFYFALPYNDFDSSGRKPSAYTTVPWADSKPTWAHNESMCKNRWIRIVKADRIAYAQWEDSGPFGEDDTGYVFGTANPANAEWGGAGLDVSPAVRDYLRLSGLDVVDWAFVDTEDVPEGPWKTTVTTSLATWD